MTLIANEEPDMYEFQIPDMNCGHCEKAVTEAVANVDPDARTTVFLSTRKAIVESRASLDRLAAALEEAGYPATATTL